VGDKPGEPSQSTEPGDPLRTSDGILPAFLLTSHARLNARYRIAQDDTRKGGR
jgi:hypothetical protein